MSILKNKALLLVGGVILLSAASFADDKPGCFDFSKPVTEALRAPLKGDFRKHDISASGKLPSGYFWGEARGEVKQPIKAVYDRLLDHFTVKDPEKMKLRIYNQDWPGYADFHVVMVEVLHLPVSVEWEENWAYAIIKGTKAAPERAIISYQKAAGSSFLAHLCGSIEITAENPNATDVSVYEEIEAFGKRSVKDTADGNLGTLRSLRKVATAPAK